MEALIKEAPQKLTQNKHRIGQFLLPQEHGRLGSETQHSKESHHGNCRKQVGEACAS